jgi:hypothetical protein
MRTQTSRRQALVVVVVLVGLVWVVLLDFWPPRDDEPAVTLDLHGQADETTPSGPTAT